MIVTIYFLKVIFGQIKELNKIKINYSFKIKKVYLHPEILKII